VAGGRWPAAAAAEKVLRRPRTSVATCGLAGTVTTMTNPSQGPNRRASLPTRSLSAAAIVAAATSFGVDALTARRAAQHLTDGSALLLVVSGKLASGKDTVAPLVMSALGAHDPVHQSYAAVLKDEMDAILTAMRTWHRRTRPAALTPGIRRQVAVLLAEQFSMPVEHAAYFTGDLLDQVLTSARVHSRSRTPAMRRALQLLGTEVRRSQDEDYWVRRALAPAVTSIADGRSVYFTDARFPNEVRGAGSLGGLSLRLDITAATQRARLSSRDGAVLDAAALVHASETSLDDFDEFDVRIDNEGPLDGTCGGAIAALQQHTATAARTSTALAG
jgi:hypothetical protein